MSGKAIVQGGNSVTMGATTVGDSLAISAPTSVQISDVVQGNNISISTSQFQFVATTPTKYGALRAAGSTNFADLSSVTVTFSSGFSAFDGEILNLVLADSITGISDSMFTIEDLDPHFGYTLSVESDAVRLSLNALEKGDPPAVPEPSTLALVVLAFAGFSASRRDRRSQVRN